jgi:uncharacterized membrane protein YfcA
MNPLAWLGAAVIGLSLGLTGAGGSILTLPVLVYLAGVPPREAVGLSLLIVGAAALAGATHRFRAGEFHLRAAALFSLSGMAGAALGARFTHIVPPGLLMTVFATLMLAVALRMAFQKNEGAEPLPDCKPLRCLLAGGGTGLLTGFLGVGGGFLLMPALMKFARLPLRIATGTSLAVIAFNSTAGFFAHLGETPPRWRLAASFSAFAVAGVIAGNTWATRLPTHLLRRGFAFIVLLTGGYVLWKTLAG